MSDVRRVIMQFEDGHTSAGYVDLDNVAREQHEGKDVYTCTVTTRPPGDS